MSVLVGPPSVWSVMWCILVQGLWTVQPGKETVVHDFPAGGWRIKEPAEGIHMTIVNGQVLLEDGKHTGALPGRVIRNSWYQAHRN